MSHSGAPAKAGAPRRGGANWLDLRAPAEPLPSRPAEGFSLRRQAPIAPAVPAIVTTKPAALPADWRDILALTKPRVMSLVVFSGLCGLLVAPQLPPFVLGFTAILCIALGAGACGALNQWYEADIDAKMRRTAKRPLPDRRMDPQAALQFGVGL